MIRAATGDEEQSIVAGLNVIEKTLAHRIIAQCHVTVVPQGTEGLLVALLSPEAAGLPAAILEGAKCGGLPIGTLDMDDGFGLGLQGAVLAADATQSQTLRVTERAARLFLYSRNILGDSVLWYDGTLKQGAVCIVCNPRGEAIGLGEVVGRFKGKGEAVHPIHDLGTYLRDQ